METNRLVSLIFYQCPFPDLEKNCGPKVLPASLGDCLFSGNNRLWVIRKCRPIRILNLWDSEVTSVGIQSALINLSPLEVILHDSFVATFGSSSSDGRNRRQHRVFVWFPCFAKEFPHWRKKPFWVGILVSVSEKRKKHLQTVSLMKILLDLLLDWKITNLTIDGTRTIVFIFSQSVDPIESIFLELFGLKFVQVIRVRNQHPWKFDRIKKFI